MTVAVCATVKNEAADAAALVASLREQDLEAGEIVIVDGGSTDGTFDALRAAAAGDSRFDIRCAPGTNIAAGRNNAISATRAPLVAVTDAGLRRSRHWLRSLVTAVQTEPRAAGSYGYILAAPETTFEAALGAVALPLAHQIDPARYPPSSGSALFRREWLQRAGGYPEWLAHGEDLWLDRAIWRAGGWFRHAPGADVGLRPRSTVAAFCRQYFLYAAGDGQAGMLVPRHVLRYGSYALGLALLLHPSPAARALLALLAAAYLGRSLRRVPATVRQTPGVNPLVAGALTPLLRIVGDLAKMSGFVAGRARRLRE
ncbi:MAG: glycosyltransferase [Chloroflexi bacterium]|nr:glycosyltransferase [Chloroflexota bacterium]